MARARPQCLHRRSKQAGQRHRASWACLGSGFNGGTACFIGPWLYLYDNSQTHPPADFFYPFDLLFSVFLGVSRWVSPHKYCCKKSMSKTNSKQIENKFDVNFVLDFFLCSRVFGCFSAMGVQTHYEKTFYKKIVSEKKRHTIAWP
jgi:hypothetical protein